MQQLILVVHVLTCISLVAMVLLQHGKGADAGAAFGSGASSTVFGSQGSTTFLFKFTSTLAAIFFATSLSLGYIASKQQASQKHLNLPLQQEQNIPAPVSPPAN